MVRGSWLIQLSRLLVVKYFPSLLLYKIKPLHYFIFLIMEKTTTAALTLVEKVQQMVDEVRSANPKLKQIFPIHIQGDEGDEKEDYIGLFRRPTMAEFSQFTTLQSKDNNTGVAAKLLATQCFLAGDKEMVEDEDVFLYGTMAPLMSIMSTRKAELVNLSKPGK